MVLRIVVGHVSIHDCLRIGLMCERQVQARQDTVDLTGGDYASGVKEHKVIR